MCSTGTQITPFMKQCFITLGVDLTSICLGCVMAFPAIMLPELYKPDSTIELTDQSGSLIAMASSLGMLGTYVLAPLIMDRLGRKISHCIVSAIFFIGFMAVSFAADAKGLIACRVLQGIAGGLLLPLSSVFLAECSSPKNRGAFLTTIALSQSVGILLVISLGSVLSWQTTSLVCMIFPFVSLIITIFTPESPSWYFSKGKYDKFIEVFRWFRGNVEEEELRLMLGSKLDKTEAEDSTDKNCFKYMKEVVKKEFYKPLIIMIHNTIMTLFSGGIIIMAFFSIILSRILMDLEVDDHLWTRYIYIANVLSNILGIFVVHQFKRRFMIFFSGALCVISHLGLVCYFYATSEGWFHKSSWIPLIFLGLIFVSDTAVITPLRSVIVGEVFPLRYRSIGASISSACDTVFAYIVVITFDSLLYKVYFDGTYLVYGAIVLYNLVILWIMLPETKGRTLLQIEEGFRGKQIQQNNVVLTELNVK